MLQFFTIKGLTGGGAASNPDRQPVGRGQKAPARVAGHRSPAIPKRNVGEPPESAGIAAWCRCAASGGVGNVSGEGAGVGLAVSIVRQPASC
ncbi:MAG: hypothetical protein KME26_01905 [Oscillatoria princeps RMCB-10]|nr:hypothetical protein [Oscillatoria princeps RMCB-10]